MKEKGSVLIFVLWVLIMLALLSAAVSYRASGDIKITRYESENIKALYLAKAGFMKMAAELCRDTNDYDSLNEGWNRQEDNPEEFKFGNGTVFYGTSDEDSRLNINSAYLQKDYLVRLGVDDTVSQRIVDYKAQKGDKGFEFMEELFLVDGVTKDIYSAIKDYVTIYRGDGQDVNINTAGEKVLNALLGGDTLIVNRILDYRKGDDSKIGTADDGIFTDNNFSVIFERFGITPDAIANYQGLFKVRSDFFRIWANASFGEDKEITKRVVGVADRNNKIYYWKES